MTQLSSELNFDLSLLIMILTFTVKWLIDGYLWWKTLYAIFCFHCRYRITFHCCFSFLNWNWILQGRGYSRGHISVPSLLIFLYFGYIVGLIFFYTCVKFKLIWVDRCLCKFFVLRNNGEKIIMVYVFKTLSSWKPFYNLKFLLV